MKKIIIYVKSISDVDLFLQIHKHICHRKVGVIKHKGRYDTAFYTVSHQDGTPILCAGFVNGRMVSHGKWIARARVLNRWDAEVRLSEIKKYGKYIAVATGIAAAVVGFSITIAIAGTKGSKTNAVPSSAVVKQVSSETTLTREEADVLDARNGTGRWEITQEVTPDHISQEEIDDEISENFDSMCDVVYAEAGNQGDKGMRLVADVIINRMRNGEAFDDTLHGVLYAAGQFSCINDGGAVKWKGHEKDEVRKICQEELEQVTDPNVYYFRTGHYGYGKPLYKYRDHYFSGR